MPVIRGSKSAEEGEFGLSRLEIRAWRDYARRVNVIFHGLAIWTIVAGTLSGGESDREITVGESLVHRMVEQMREDEGFEDSRVLEAMREVPRHWFVPRRLQAMAYYDMALPIGRGQTISPPSMVARMIDRLNPGAEDRVLEVGTGTGYQAAVLSRMSAEVCTIEIEGSLARKARSTLKRLRCLNGIMRGNGPFIPGSTPIDGRTLKPSTTGPRIASELPKSKERRPAPRL